ncbi:hypothetical protein ACFS7Z_20905 [Pontibacter toksunensis]|uniref:Uncharacterized protein n=1 Tax=Pontibacter toksunensis TaxID=1332631 RepID=A0ABW6C048_9BACT
MDLSEFNYHAPHERAELVWEYGRFLCIRYKGGCSIVLYHMGDFFAEVWYSPTQNRIRLVRGFSSRANLEPYLKMIDLAWLMGEGQ